MKELISEYVKGCKLLRMRIRELSSCKNDLHKAGRQDEIIRLDLERRIALLYTEHRQAKETIDHLCSYSRRVEQRVETDHL